MSDSSILSPDESLVRLERWQSLSPEQQGSFPPLCPDLVEELASPSNNGPVRHQRSAAKNGEPDRRSRPAGLAAVAGEASRVDLAGRPCFLRT